MEKVNIWILVKNTLSDLLEEQRDIIILTTATKNKIIRSIIIVLNQECRLNLEKQFFFCLFDPIRNIIEGVNRSLLAFLLKVL